MKKQSLSLEKIGDEIAEYLNNERFKRSREMNDLIIATIRTMVPGMVVYFITFLTARGVEIDEVTQTSIETALIGLFIALYYSVIRTLGKKYPKLEILLGSTKTPQYSPEKQ